MSTVRVPELINWLESRKKATLAYFGEVLLPNTGGKYQALWNRMVSARKLEVYVNPEAVESIVFAYIAVIRQGRGDEKTKNPNLEDLQKAHAPMANVLFVQYKIILPNSFSKANTCNRSLFGRHG
ncbi:MAG: hypothetical protein ACE362_26315 [Phaeodactylibacter xiamenensis]|uniref:Uncharacterized protein n=1 Tax=Phaeodactylibacter xiamenensis TaxID=1524460 RepID=A0A098S076_9BACT|nr:hypothetical protein [Phaeodactylibacter xiamenensis]KGE85540.1 hypothetical protein IX84_27080 [Phaeodactylibacter xiamenensis]MCR9051923.1 hypothetical protein [bacterium]